MSIATFLPHELFLHRQDVPHVGGARPLSQGDVFLGIPLLRAAKEKERHPGQWTAQVKGVENALGMLVSHPCSSRSRTTHALKESVSVAPISRCPPGFAVPWTGYYEYFPLPGLREGADYVADLSAICPVRSGFLEAKRIACLTAEGLAALFYRLAVNFTRLDRMPDHYSAEADWLFSEMSLWEIWTVAKGTEVGFQSWLDGEFTGTKIRRDT
jgi:hypothetical protein